MITVRQQLVGQAVSLIEYLEDELVTDILVNGIGSLYIEKSGVLSSVSSPFTTKESILHFIERLLVPLGRRIDAAHPYADGRLCNGDRFHVILPPLAMEGPLISIRKVRRRNAFTLESFGDRQTVAWLRKQIQSRSNLLIGGATGTGKTSLIACLLDEVSEHERILVLEETREIESSHPHLLHLEARAQSVEGRGEVTLRDLFRNALRMRPDRVVIGECRGSEAWDLIQALNSGHAGSFCTLHCRSGLDGLRRLESLALLSGFCPDAQRIREWVASAIQGVVFLQRSGGMRKVTEIIQVHGMEGEVFRITPVFGGSHCKLSETMRD